MLLLFLGGDVSLNPGPIALGVLNARSIRNKGTALADTMATNNMDILRLTERLSSMKKIKLYESQLQFQLEPLTNVNENNYNVIHCHGGTVSSCTINSIICFSTTNVIFFLF